MKKETSKINIFKKCKNKLNDFIVKLGDKLNRKYRKEANELVDKYAEEIKEYLYKRFMSSRNALLNGVDIEVLPYGTLVEGYDTTDLIGDEKVLLIELSPSDHHYKKTSWQVRFNFLYLTKRTTSDDDRFEQYLDQSDALLVLFSLMGKIMKYGEIERETIERTSMRTIPTKLNNSKELRSTIYEGKVCIDKQYRLRWRAFTKNVNSKFLAAWSVALTVTTLITWFMWFMWLSII